MNDIPQPDWQRHETEEGLCGRCANGFPYSCPCGGWVHSEMVEIPGNGFVQFMRCERCEEADQS